MWDEHECARAASAASELLADAQLAIDLLHGALQLNPRMTAHDSTVHAVGVDPAMLTVALG